MSEISSAAIFGATLRKQYQKANRPPPIKLNPFNLPRASIDAAKSLPVELFLDDSLVLKHQRAIEERKEQIPAEIRQWLDTELASLNKEIAYCEQTLARKVFADAVAKDTDFGKTEAALNHLRFLKDLVAAIDSSKDGLESLMAQAVGKDQVVIDMHTQIGDRLWVLRVAHLEKKLNQERDHMDGLTDD